MDRTGRLSSAVVEMMEAAWREPGFCVPNQDTYPHQWLWDSCFHAVIWCRLHQLGRCEHGLERAETEIASALTRQDEDGFVPHMIYWTEPNAGVELWGRTGRSSITQPPMYGHAMSEIRRAGGTVADDLVVRAGRGLSNLLARPRTPGGLIPVFHPWETGCDDSARWDDHHPDTGLVGSARVEAWRATKAELVAALQTGDEGQALGSSAFSVGSVGFNALVAWNIRELLDVAEETEALGDDERRGLAVAAEELTAAVSSRWVGDRWVDDGVGEAGRVRTLDTMAALLVEPRDAAFDDLVDPDAFGAPFGPRGVDRREPSYDPDTYWRGPAWPQLGYLMMVAAHRSGRPDVAESVAAALVKGAERSGLAEYWNPEHGEGLGARPQTWSGLGLAAQHFLTSFRS